MTGFIWTQISLLIILPLICAENLSGKTKVANHVPNEDVEVLVNRIHSLESEMKRVKEILEVLTPDNIKKDLFNFIETRGIEEDVEENKEDIIDLKVTDSHHDVLISQAFSDTKILNLTIEHELQVIRTDIDTHNDFLDQTRPPIGSIIAWLPGFTKAKDIPQGWQRCDGSLIKAGPLRGQPTPDLNTSGRFMRGGTDALAAQVQEDAVQDHTHQDNGHSHKDSGHTHSDSGHGHYMDSTGDGHHFPMFIESDEAHAEDIVCTDNYHSCGGYFLRAGEVWKTESTKASISTNSANIQSSNSGISGMSSGRMADETRPKNMNVVFIIRTF